MGEQTDITISEEQQEEEDGQEISCHADRPGMRNVTDDYQDAECQTHSSQTGLHAVGR